MNDFEKLLDVSLKDSDFKREWENSELEYQIMKMLVMTRCEKNQDEKVKKCIDTLRPL